MIDEIYLFNHDGAVATMRAEDYDSEDVLQRLLAEYPNLLAGAQLNPVSPRRWLLVKREVGIPVAENGVGYWSADHLFLDQDGVPLLVEVKRRSDTRIRREVVGQMLDYAANTVLFGSADEIIRCFHARCREVDLDPESELQDFLGADGESDGFWKQVEDNIRAGRIRLLFVADRIPTDLLRVIQFLGSQMNPAEVFALEVKQYRGSGLQVLVPRLLGQATKAIKSTAGQAIHQWDQESFFAAMAARNATEEADAARNLLHWARQKATRVWWGSGKRYGSFGATVTHGGLQYYLFAVYHTGSVELHFQYLKARPAFASDESRMELLRRINAIPGVALPDDSISRRPTLKLAELATNHGVQHLVSVMDWLVKRICNDDLGGNSI